jgi:hypothetical protein
MPATKELPYTLTVSRKGEPAWRRGFHTVKSARHFAKQVANNSAVKLIELTGPDVNATVLYPEC